MKEADVDWLVYHRIPEGSSVSADVLADRCGLQVPEVEASLARLERSCLVERSGSSVRILSVGEALLRNQLNYEEDLPFVLEDGVVKEKNRDSCRKRKL